MTPEEMQDRLRESGIDSELVTYPNPKAVGVKWHANGIVWTYDWYGQTPQALSTYMHYLPEQAIAATVGDKPKDNPRNYNPDGTPKIPNMNIGADPDWVDWVASLECKEPLSLTEAVKQLMFEVICFGGEMGPNDCGGEYCPDEGMVYTNDFINCWVNKIAATVGIEEMYTREECEAQFVRGFSLGSLPSGSDPQWDENRQTLDDHMAELGWVRRYAATVGTGTCKNTQNDFDFMCSECGKCVDNGRVLGFNYCPNCGKRIEVSE